MNREEVLMIFRNLLDGTRDKITYSTGYKIFDEMFEIFKEFGLVKREEGIYTVVEKIWKNYLIISS